MTGSASLAPADEWRGELARALGADRLAEPGEGARVDGVAPGIVARPRSIDEARAAVRVAAAHGLAVVASGRGRHLDVGGLPERCDIVLRLEHLSQVLDHQPDDMTVSVGAGCTLAALQRKLAGHGQWLPLDPPAPDATTIGGLVAANLSGPLRSSQGTARDLMIGIEVIAADGAIVHGGGRVVKNVAGYDLPKLHVGALGSLGLITSVTFKVRPRPALERAVVIGCPSAEDAGLVALALRDAVEPFWLEIARAGPSTDGEANRAPWEVIAGVAGIPAEVKDAISRIEHAASVRGLEARGRADGATEREALAARAQQARAAVLRASVLPTTVGEALEVLAAAAQTSEARIGLFAHAASGIVRATIDEAAVVLPLLRSVRPEIARFGGHVVVERASATAKQELRSAGVDPWGDAGSGLELMRGIKEALDPGRIFAPGRMPGGI